MDTELQDPNDDLEGMQTPLQRLVSRSKGWVAALLVVALVVPLGSYAIDEFAFGTAGDAVEEQLGVDADLADALLLVHSSDCLGRSSTGSAFAVQLDGQPVVVTNRHVVEDASSTVVRPLDGGAALQVVGHRVSDAADVAVLDLADDAEVARVLVTGQRAAPGDDVRVIGFPAGRPAISTGPVASADSGRLLLDLRVDPGASGSPVLDEDGRVVGQVHARTSEGRGVATPVAALLAAAAGARDAEPCP